MNCDVEGSFGAVQISTTGTTTNITGGFYGNGLITVVGTNADDAWSITFNNLPDINMNYVGNINAEGKVSLDGTSSFASTVLGWDESNAAADEENPVIDTTNVNFGNADYGLGEVRPGDEDNATGDKSMEGTGDNIPEEVPGININGTVSDNTNFTADTTISESVTYSGVVTIAEGVKVTVANGVELKFDTGSIVNLYGSIEIATGVSAGTVVNNGTLYVLNENASYPAQMSGSGTVDTSAVSSEAGLRGELKTDSVFTEQQIVTVDGDLTLVAGTQLVIEGKLIIPEGITVTIQEGAQLVIRGQAAAVENNGTIIVSSDNEDDKVGTPASDKYSGGLVIIDGIFVNNGTISAQYYKEDVTAETQDIVVISADAVMTNNGTITIGSESGISIAGTLKNIAGATFAMNGELSAQNGIIENAGDITINGTITAVTTITMVAADASVDVISLYTGNDTTYLQVDVTIPGTTSKPITGDAGIRISGYNNYAIGGITVVASTVTEGTGQNAKMYNSIGVSGTITATYVGDGTPGTLTEAPTQLSVYGKVSITENMTVGSNTAFNFGGSKGAVDLTVSGNVQIDNIGTNVASGSEVTVTGVLQTYDSLTSINALTVNAANYRVTNTGENAASEPNIYYYTTLENAIASGNTTIGVTGQIEVTADVTVPSGTTVTQVAGTNNDGKITITEDATLTFATGSRLVQNGFSTPNAGTYNGIDVEGTLYIEDSKNTLRSFNEATTPIYSEVHSSTGADMMFTSLANAMDAAVEGSDTVIELYNKAVSIDRTTFTIKSGVTVDTNGQNFTVNGSTLIINGTLFIDGGTYDVKDDTTTTEGYTYKGTVTLNGYIRSTSAFEYNGTEYPAGAYYTVTGSGIPMYYATTVANAAQSIMDVDNNTITLCGKLSIGDVSFSGTADEQAYVVIDDGADITAGTVTIDEARITIGKSNGATFIGTIASSEGSVQFARDTGITAGAYIEDDTTSSNGTRMTVVAITTGTADTPGNVTIDGTVYIGASSNIYNLTVQGTANVVANGVQATAVTVNGTLDVAVNCSLIAGTIYVNGTLSTAVATADTPGQGTVTVTDLYVGVTRENGKLVDGVQGTVSGNVTLSGDNHVAYVSNGSTVPESFSNLENTEFYVEDTLWITAYGTTADVSNAPVTDARFDGWNDAKGESAYPVATANAIDLSKYPALYADIEYNVYSVQIKTDGGISSVAIDGNLMNNELGGNVFTATGLTAGEHKVTYTLKNGFQGEAVLSSSDLAVSGNTFTLTGDFDTTYVLNLAGTEPADQTIVIDGGNNGGSDSLGLTDYLLIILVILIVIMAIIVASRMMRS